MPPSDNPQSIYLIDGSAFIYRAFHAVAPLSTSAGLPTNAIYGFVNILLKIIRDKSPAGLAVVFDSKGPNFRHSLYPDYKANRPSMPEELACQLPYIKEIVAAYRLLSLESAGFEADDLIASAVARLEARGLPLVIVSGDKDLLQLVSAQTRLWDPMKDKLMDEAAIKEKYQVSREQLLDYFSLMGDSSDNIPGISGIGPKTAAKLIEQFGSLDGLFEGLDKVATAKLKEKLKEGKDAALLSRDLIRLCDDLPVPDDIEAYRLPEADQPRLKELFKKLEFYRLLKSETQPVRLANSGYKLVRTTNELQEMVAVLTAADDLVIDTETSSLEPLSARLVGIALSNTGKAVANQGWYIPLGHKDSEGRIVDGQIGLEELKQTLKTLFSAKDIVKIGHNLKYDLQVLHRHGIKLSEPLADTMLASYLINPERQSHKLDDLSAGLLDLQLTAFSELCPDDKQPEPFAFVPPETACNYACEDVVATARLWQLFAPELKQHSLDQLFYQVEMPLLPILARMERVGISLDSESLKTLSDEFAEELERLEEKIIGLAGSKFNINSAKQLGEVLYERLQLPTGKKTKGKTGYSTNIKELERLSVYHELPAAIIAHRNLNKLKSSYADKLGALVSPEDGRVHSSFNQTVTATGRLSSSNPNLQNIPIRSPEGQKLRALFVAAPGHNLLAADYSQIDLRVMAHYSQDPVLLQAFRDNEDIHNRTAAEIFRVHPLMISPEMRRVAKTINFGIIYGISAFGLASQFRCSRKEAQTFIDRYFALYKGVKEFMLSIVAQAARDGFVSTLLNRRRYLPEINSKNKIKREAAERAAINSPIQGTAADIIKLAAIECDRVLRAREMKTEALLQIHDELIFEVPKEEQGEVDGLIKPAMEQVMELSVPLTVNIQSGLNLAETK